jgi:hypothetical protein
LEIAASFFLSAAHSGNIHAGIHSNPFAAAFEKIPLSVGHVNNKPQYLVFIVFSSSSRPLCPQTKANACAKLRTA